jgi:hypothetical protein
MGRVAELVEAGIKSNRVVRQDVKFRVEDVELVANMLEFLVDFEIVAVELFALSFALGV